MSPAISEVRQGFYLGLGVAAALAVWAIAQMLLSRAAKRG